MLRVKSLSRPLAHGVLLAGGILLAAGQMAHAIPSDQNQPVVLEADRATFNDKTGLTSYTGNVIVTQGTIRIEADSMVMNLEPNRSIRLATAKGRPARFQQQVEAGKGLTRGEGQTIVYDARTSIVTLTGNAYLNNDGATFNGNQLRYSMARGDVEATSTPKGRVRLVIPPNMTRSGK